MEVRDGTGTRRAGRTPGRSQEEGAPSALAEHGVEGMIGRAAPWIVVAALVAPSVHAAERSPSGEPEKGPSREEIEAWLESRALPADISADETPEAPPESEDLRSQLSRELSGAGEDALRRALEALRQK